METGTPHLLLDRDGPVAFLTFNRPQARNAITFEMCDALVLQAYLSEDFQEGVSAFQEKRKPQWKGR